jgi:lipopolysaccharide heptosyltransferase II
MTRPETWSRARRILAVRLDALGDVLMTTPALRALKGSAPGRHVTLLTSPGGAAVAPMLPDVDDCLVYEAPWMKATPGRADARLDHATIDRLRAGRFDAAVIFTVYSQNPLPAATLLYLADIPLRLAHCRENPYQLLTDWIAESEPGPVVRHEVRRQLDLVAAVGCIPRDERLALHVPRAARERVGSLLRSRGIGDGTPFVVVHPGVSAPSRRYPPEGYAEAARLLVRDHGLRVVFTGSAGEHDLVESIRGAMGEPSHSLAGRLDLAELAALLGRSPLLIANNTGPVHVAAAVGTPVVDLYALTNPQHTPWGVPSRVLNHPVPCAPCYRSVCPEGHHDCLRLVPPAAIVRAALELLDTPGAPRDGGSRLAAASPAPSSLPEPVHVHPRP